MRYSAIFPFVVSMLAWNAPAHAAAECRDTLKTKGNRQVTVSECRGEDGVWREDAAMSAAPYTVYTNNGFRGKIIYRGSFSHQDFAKHSGALKTTDGGFEVTLEFNGSSVDGRFAALTGAGNGQLHGRVNNGICQLYEHDGTIWSGPCDFKGFNGEYNFSTVRNQIHGIFQLSSTQVIDYDERDKQAAKVRAQQDADAKRNAVVEATKEKSRSQEHDVARKSDTHNSAGPTREASRIKSATKSVNASSCLMSNSSSRRVYSGQSTAFGPSYTTEYNTVITNVCKYSVSVVLIGGGILGSNDEITLAPNETHTVTDAGIGAVRAVPR